MVVKSLKLVGTALTRNKLYDTTFYSSLIQSTHYALLEFRIKCVSARCPKQHDNLDVSRRQRRKDKAATFQQAIKYISDASL